MLRVFQLCYVRDDSEIVCQLPGYNLSPAFLDSLVANYTDETTSAPNDIVLQANTGFSLSITTSLNASSSRRKRDTIAQYPATPVDSQDVFTLSVTMGIILDGYDYYKDIKAAIPNIDYRLTADIPVFYDYYVPEAPYSPGSNMAIDLYVSLQHLQELCAIAHLFPSGHYAVNYNY